MSDDRSKKGTQDRTRINANEDYELLLVKEVWRFRRSA